VDPLPLSTDHTTSVYISSLTQNGRLLLYGVRRGGQDESELRVLDVKTRRDLPDRLPTAWYGRTSWKKDCSGFYYMLSRREIGKRIYYHAIGTNPTTDREIFGEGHGPEV
jgi:prolyl oligopeptidase